MIQADTYCASRSCKFWPLAYDSKYSATSVPLIDTKGETELGSLFCSFASSAKGQFNARKSSERYLLKAYTWGSASPSVEIETKGMSI